MADTHPRLNAAERRLEDALARLEAILAARSGQPAGIAEAAAGGHELGEAIADVRRQNDELKALSRDAASRLDQAIAQIDLLLED